MPDDIILQPDSVVMGVRTTPRSAMQDAFQAAQEQQTPDPETKEEVNTDGQVSP